MSPSADIRRATCQLLHVEGDRGSVVVDLLPLGGDHMALGGDGPSDPVTVGLAVRPGVPRDELDELRDTLDHWNHDHDAICDVYVVPSGDTRRLVFVHRNDVIVIETE